MLHIQNSGYVSWVPEWIQVCDVKSILTSWSILTIGYTIAKILLTVNVLLVSLLALSANIS